mmetsp:Transcript_8945/g.26849  ORF Transcript_8945/g.26849 Transcript_8945/m.26849 type:complete len:351 (+) Transcript_8945:191-1243(+)
MDVEDEGGGVWIGDARVGRVEFGLASCNGGSVCERDLGVEPVDGDDVDASRDVDVRTRRLIRIDEDTVDASPEGDVDVRPRRLDVHAAADASRDVDLRVRPCDGHAADHGPRDVDVRVCRVDVDVALDAPRDVDVRPRPVDCDRAFVKAGREKHSGREHIGGVRDVGDAPRHVDVRPWRLCVDDDVAGNGCPGSHLDLHREMGMDVSLERGSRGLDLQYRIGCRGRRRDGRVGAAVLALEERGQIAALQVLSARQQRVVAVDRFSVAGRRFEARRLIFLGAQPTWRDVVVRAGQRRGPISTTIRGGGDDRAQAEERELHHQLALLVYRTKSDSETTLSSCRRLSGLFDAY